MEISSDDLAHQHPEFESEEEMDGRVMDDSFVEEGSSKPVDRFEIFRVYFKSFVRDEAAIEIRNSISSFVGGIGIAIFDSRDNLIYKLAKPMPETDRIYLGFDCFALIEALNFALSLNLTRVEFYYDCFPLFQYVQGIWKPKESKHMELVDQILLLRNKFEFINELFVEPNYIKHALKLAREAVAVQINSTLEICVICFDNNPDIQIFQTDGCSHRYCFSCMTQHVKMKLLDGLLPKCPHEECNYKLKIEDCKVFLPDELIVIMSDRMNEASIPATEKVYCPFPKCSALMSRKEIEKNLRICSAKCEQNEARNCVKCENIFCISCMVPWHESLSCSEYKRLNPDPPAEEVKLKKLADANLWQQCKKCRNMIELSFGCFHITCRCGNEFCYICGAERKHNFATCSCQLLDEQNLLDDDDELLDVDNYNDDEEYYDEEYYDEEDGDEEDGDEEDDDEEDGDEEDGDEEDGDEEDDDEEVGDEEDGEEEVDDEEVGDNTIGVVDLRYVS